MQTGRSIPPASKPRLSIRIIGWILIVVLIIGFAEFLAFLFYVAKDGRWLSARARLLEEPNKFIAEVINPSKCAYIDSLYPHPYLAFVHKRHGPCSLAWINKTGLFGRDYPVEYDQTKFTILLVGGSVAAQFAQIYKGEPLFLEEELNRCYRPPHGDKFVVLNGADGAWKQPQQAIIYLIYGGYVDAVVALDGFNEYSLVFGGARLGIPANNFVTANPLVMDSYATIAAAWLSKNLVSYVATNSFLNKSYVVALVVHYLHGLLEAKASLGHSEYKQNFIDMFSLPSDWTSEQRYHFNIEQYRRYIRAIAAIANVQHAKSAFFIQPVPAIGKVLTDQEKKAVGSLAYAANYQRMTDDLLDLSKEGISIFSLLHVLDQEKETLYGDPIHFERNSMRGNQILADVVARRLSDAWHLERTCGQE